MKRACAFALAVLLVFAMGHPAVAEESHHPRHRHHARHHHHRRHRHHSQHAPAAAAALYAPVPHSDHPVTRTCKTDACRKKHPSGHYKYVKGQHKAAKPPASSPLPKS